MDKEKLNKTKVGQSVVAVGVVGNFSPDDTSEKAPENSLPVVSKAYGRPVSGSCFSVASYLLLHGDRPGF